MRLVDRYLLRELLVPFSYCLSGFLVFWVSFDLFAELSDFQKLKLTAGDILEYYLVTTPANLVFVLPVAFLLALLYTLTNHARHNELTAIRAAGVSLARLALPYVAVGLVLSLGLFAVNEVWVPDSIEMAEQILARRQANRSNSPRRQWELKLGFYNYRDNRSWLIEAYNTLSGDMIRPNIIWTLADGTRHQILAERGAYVDGVWVFTNLHRIFYSPTPGVLPAQEELETLAIPEFSETPEQIKSEIKISKLNSFRAVRKAQLSIREILDYRRLHPGDTSRSAVLDTKLQGRLAAPWTCLVVVAIALPFGAASGRRNVVVGVASSILICFLYFVLLQLALALGTGGYVPPWAAAWAPNIFFGAAGMLMIWKVR